MTSNPRQQNRRDYSYEHSGGTRQPNNRYLYDVEERDYNSEVSVGDSLVSDFSSLQGFALEPFEDEQSETTNKMNNLSSVKHGRKFPKHHGGYQGQGSQWRRHRVVRFQDDTTRISAVTEDAVMDFSDSMNFYDANIADDEDSEYPTNVDSSFETRRTTDTSIEDEEEQIQILMLVRGDFTSTTKMGEDDISSIGVINRPNPSVLTACLPSINTMSRWFFFLGCVLSLWLAIDGLVWAKEQKKLNNSSISKRYETRQRRLKSPPVTHQQQWSSNSTGTWDQLAKEEQESWSQLGFDEELWDNHNGVASDEIEWDELTDAQVEAALELGFSPPVWDHFNIGNSRSDNDNEDASDDSSPPAESMSFPSAQATMGPTVAQTTSTTSPSTKMPIIPSTTLVPQRLPSDLASSGRDYSIFTLGSITVTKHMILSFAAALCFTMVGVIEWIQYDYLFQLLLAISGVWGLLSSMFIYRNPATSLAFHTLSEHFFFGAAVLVLWLRYRQPTIPAQSRSNRAALQTQEELLLLADLCLATGALMACISSYMPINHGADAAALMVDVQRLNVFSAILWVFCAVVYLCLTRTLL
jgi:hypothetical protein